MLTLLPIPVDSLFLHYYSIQTKLVLVNHLFSLCAIMNQTVGNSDENNENELLIHYGWYTSLLHIF